MTFVIAAAGTGGHVFPGLSVGQALVDKGVAPDEVLFIGGDRLEATVYPEAGFPFLGLEVRGLQRSLTPRNLTLPSVMRKAKLLAMEEMVAREARAVLGMGGYVSVPVGMAARSLRLPFFNAEQNANAGLASRVTARWARKTFTAFPRTSGLPAAEWVGNPVRRPFWDFDRAALRSGSLSRYGLSQGVPTLGVFGGSLGARALNEATVSLVRGWEGPEIQVVHITGERFHGSIETDGAPGGAKWVTLPFEPEMEWFYAAADLVLARAGGAVAELTATATPSLLVPGDFGSGGHQEENARFLADVGAALVVTEDELGSLPAMVASVLLDDGRREKLVGACREIARPRAAHVIADHLIEAASP